MPYRFLARLRRAHIEHLQRKLKECQTDLALRTIQRDLFYREIQRLTEIRK